MGSPSVLLLRDDEKTEIVGFQLIKDILLRKKT